MSQHGIPVTTPARTLLDLAAQLPQRALERALDEAQHRELFDLTALNAVVRAHPSERGAAKLAQALDQHAVGTTLTKTTLEELMLSICDRFALPRPLVNTWIAGLEVDFYWPAQRLVVEADSYRFHHTRRAFERDRERDALLARQGCRTLRFTHRQMERRPEEVAATIKTSA